MKEFASFTNRRMVNANLFEKPFIKVLNFLQDEEWKCVRNTVTPTFSGGKLRKMQTEINTSSRILVEKLRAKAEAGEPFNVKDFMGGLTMDVLTSIAFGLDIDSQRDPNDQFVKHAKILFSRSIKSPLQIVLLIFPSLVPVFKRLFDVSYFPKDTTQFFTSILNQAIASRSKDDKTGRMDFLQLLINAHIDENGAAEGKMNKTSQGTGQSQKGLTYDQILGQGFMFFMSAYNTAADTLGYILYLLAVHPDIQKKALQDIQSVLMDREDPDYESVNKMQYIGMVVEESLRLYPPTFRLERTCNSDVMIKGVQFTKGMRVVVPVMVLHLDPTVWPEPEQFRPERFTPKLKLERDPFYWQAFGMGPRNCIGMRFALMEMKMVLVHVLQNFEVQICDATTIPIIRDKLTGKPSDLFLCVKHRMP